MGNFIQDFNKDTNKMDSVTTYNKAPSFWIDSGNIIINKILSGKYNGGYAQGRLALLAGASGSGKSFLLANSMRAAQKENAGILIIDSEHALDEEYLRKIGVDVEAPNFLYRGVKTINDASKIVSSFIKSYRTHGIEDKFIIVIDSLDLLLTEAMLKSYDDGDTGHDQGQHAKQIKRMLVTFMHDIKDLNIALLCSKQPYKEQDPIKARRSPWVLTESAKFPFSQIAMLTKLLLKDKKTNEENGITLKVFGEKTRFTKPFQQCKIEVPYEEGMDRYSGILEAAASFEIIEKNGGWYTFKNKKFQESTLSEELKKEILDELMACEEKVLNVEITDQEFSEDGVTLKELRKNITEKHNEEK